MTNQDCRSCFDSKAEARSPPCCSNSHWADTWFQQCVAQRVCCGEDKSCKRKSQRSFLHSWRKDWSQRQRQCIYHLHVVGLRACAWAVGSTNACARAQTAAHTHTPLAWMTSDFGLIRVCCKCCLVLIQLRVSPKAGKELRWPLMWGHLGAADSSSQLVDSGIIRPDATAYYVCSPCVPPNQNYFALRLFPHIWTWFISSSSALIRGFILTFFFYSVPLSRKKTVRQRYAINLHWSSLKVIQVRNAAGR